LTREELESGGAALRAKIRQYRPRTLAVLGVGAYRTAFSQPKAQLGEQPERIDDTRIWVLPNPSGLNAHYQRDALARLFRELRDAVPPG
jgi:TDG/mug DNA glycosylase family protein